MTASREGLSGDSLKVSRFIIWTGCVNGQFQVNEQANNLVLRNNAKEAKEIRLK